MKPNHSAWLLAGMLALLPLTTRAADITITVNGRVVAKPCTISTPTADVALGDLSASSLSSAGAASAWHDVKLDLNNCPEGTSQVTATFSGTADGTGYYQNQGTAGNIQLELQDTGGTRLNNGAQKTVPVDNNSQAASFALQVRALTVQGAATQGTIKAVINVTYTWA